MKNEGFLQWVLPLEVRECKRGREKLYHVKTASGFPVGHRLLKGVKPPDIDDFGPFNNKEEADILALTLTFHIRSDWPDRARYKSKKTRINKGLV